MKLKFLAIIALLFASSFGAAQTIEKQVRVASPGAGESRYFYIPFDVPENARSLSVGYEYDKQNGANVLDLGLFNARFDLAETNLRGFRGWSGGRRSTIFVGENAASHGYLPGKLPAGEWRVILGLYKVKPEGVEVIVKIRINEIEPQAQADWNSERNKTFALPDFKPAPAPETVDGYTWFRGDLHAHTFHSDGWWTIEMLLAWAEKSGLNFVGVTEHNTASHHREIDELAKKYPNLLVLRGEEVTTYGGHFNVWNLPSGETIDFRVTPKDAARLREVVSSVRRLGLVASLNHPTALCGGCDWSYGDWSEMDAIEIWNGAWDAQDEAALKKWDELLQSGRRIAALGSSDTHVPPLGDDPPAGAAPLGAPTNHVGVKTKGKKPSPAALLAAVKSGRLWISAAPTAYSLKFSASADDRRFRLGDEIFTAAKTIKLDCRLKGFPAGAKVLLGSNGKTLLAENAENFENGWTRNFDVAGNSYFRLEVRDAANKMLALTNPIFVRRRQ